MSEDFMGYDFVRFTLCDIHGIPKTRVIPGRHVKQFIEEGTKVCKALIYYAPNCLSCDGIACGFDNIAAKPVLDAFHPLPWAAEGQFKIAEFLCEPHDIDTGVVLSASPRALARRQLDRLQEKDLKLVSACEMEFTLLHKESKKPIFPKPNIATPSGIAPVEKFLYTLDKHMSTADIDIESIQDEAGAGQMELCIYPSQGIIAADQVFKFKQAVREIALQHEMIAVFMSMPFYPFASGLHFNHSILNENDENVFFDASQDNRLSEFAGHWIAGILKHAKALAVLCAPTINCYRRFHMPWSPSTVNWGLDDRMATLRVKNNGPKGTYMENRLPSGSANPYIVMAATVAAGLDGVEKKLQCPAVVECKDAPERIPKTLEEALEELKADNVLCEALGTEFISRFMEEKECVQIALFKDWSPEDQSEETMEKERDLYLEFM